MKLAPPTHCSRSAGSALTIVLITVAMVVLLVVLALSIASIDRRNSANALGREAAQALGEVALDEVASKIASIPLDRHWAAAPGRLRIWNGSGWDQVDLHSGDGSGNTNPDESVDLNARLSDGTYPILPPNQEFPTAPEMRVRWIYVSEDGSTSTTPPASGVIGRYAYWADIENGRVNLNTAGLGMTSDTNKPTGQPTGWKLKMPGLQTWVEDLGSTNSTSLTNLNQSQFLTQYRNEVWAKNPWVSDRVGIDTNTGRPTFPPLSLNEARQNTPQYLTAHPSSINLSYLDGVSADEGFNTFRYAGSYFLRADALTSMLRGGEVVTSTEPFYWDQSLAGNVDLSVRFFDAPEDWQRIVDADTFEANKGYITVRGRTPEITPWGTPKLAISLAAREHANQRNDLTETDHRRNARLLSNVTSNNSHWYQNVQDTRVVQMPALNPGHNEGFTASEAGRFHRLMIRDITAASYDAGPANQDRRRTPNRLSAIWAIRQHLGTPLPGVPGTLAAKYDASSPGEADQVAIEMATFFDNQLSSHYPGRTKNLITLRDLPSIYTTNTTVNQMHFSGRRLPYVATASGGPPIRRLGSHGGPLLNEVRARASSVPVITPTSGTTLRIIANQSYNVLSTLTKLGDDTLTVSSPVARLSESGTGGRKKVSAVFLLRQPTWINPPPAPLPRRTNDRFIRVEFDTELLLPELWSLRSESPAYDKNDFRYFAHLNDVVCEVGGLSLRANYGIPNNAKDGDTDEGQFNLLGSTIKGDNTNTPENSMTPGNTLPLNRAAGIGSVFIGPFAPDAVVSFKLKIRIVVNHADRDVNNPLGTWQLLNNSAAYASVVPGIFPDVTAPPTGTSGEEVDSFLEFDFNNFNMADDQNMSESVGLGTAVSLEARDPRVTRRNSDWTVRLPDPPNGLYLPGSIGGPNPGSSPPATADLYRPDPLLQHVRGMLRTRIASDATPTSSRFHLETQSATRILGLPGVGYLSSIPTGVNSGIPWQTMKFQDSTEPVPDWLLWSLFYVPFDRSIHNQTDGKLNINATLWPWGIERARPLEALLGDRVSNPEILSRSIASAAGSGKSIGPNDMFVYPGQICQVPGVTGAAAEETDKEALARDLADIITTQCDDYRVFVIAQPLRQAPDGTFTPLATVRLEATISRSPDEGGGGFFFGPQGAGGLGVFTRAAYQSAGTRGARINAGGSGASTPSDPNPSHPNGFSHLGRDGLPDTSDDWLIPQKIQISRLRYLP